MKKIIIYLILVCLITPNVSYAESINVANSNTGNEKVKLYVNGHYIKNDFEGKYFIEENRTYTQVRGISEELGYKVDYDEKTKDIKISLDGNKDFVLLNLNSDIIRHGKTENKMGIKPILKNNSVFIPIRFCAEMLGQKIEWDEKSKSVYIGERLSNVELENLVVSLKKAYPQEIKNEINDYTILKVHEDKNYSYRDVDLEMINIESKERTAYQLAIGISKDGKKSIKVFERSFFTSKDKLTPIGK